MSEEVTRPHAGYVHSWTPSLEATLDDFLSSNKPSKIYNDSRNSKPYVWISNSELGEEVNYPEAIEEAKAVLKDTATKVSEVQANDDIPIRANKKKGLKSKKEVREEIQAQAASQLKEVAAKHGYVSGKWLIFADSNQVDTIFWKLAHSLISGELSHTSAFRIAAGTLPASDGNESPHRHNLMIYFPNMYDQGSAKEASTLLTGILTVLARHHGLKAIGAKPDLYTVIGLDSKHTSGMYWKASGAEGLLKEEEIKALRDAYYQELEASREATEKGADEGRREKVIIGKRLPTGDGENPFASDEEGDSDQKAPAPGNMTNPKKRDAVVKKNSHENAGNSTRKRPVSDSEDSEGQDEPPKKVVKSNTASNVKKRGPAPKIKPSKKKADSSSDSD
ncbi:hypothetical protein CPB86DRAFT_760133 [Serendipita vermifera]|nr:hypothetical protein CPB86DRAFT_760133 [Serendipita vermifera]